MLTGWDAIGLAGITLSIGCYARAQWQREYVKRLSYSALNFLSSVLLGLSILHDWNLSAFISNVAWALLSLYGVYRCLKYLRKQPSLDGK